MLCLASHHHDFPEVVFEMIFEDFDLTFDFVPGPGSCSFCSCFSVSVGFANSGYLAGCFDSASAVSVCFAPPFVSVVVVLTVDWTADSAEDGFEDYWGASAFCLRNFS